MPEHFNFFKTMEQRIIKSIEMQSLLTVKHNKTLLIFDLDDTVMRSLTRVASEAYYHHCIDELVAAGWDESEATKEINKQYNDFQFASHQAALADDSIHIGKLIAMLQQKGIHVIALTARESVLLDVTLAQLDGLNVHFSEDVIGEVEIEYEDHLIKSKRGIICASNLNKGLCLSLITKNTRLNLRDYDEIKFFDDRISNCRDMSAFLETVGVPYQTNHYPFVSNTIRFDEMALAVAEFQAQYYEKHNTIPNDKDTLNQLKLIKASMAHL